MHTACLLLRVPECAYTQHFHTFRLLDGGTFGVFFLAITGLDNAADGMPCPDCRLSYWILSFFQCCKHTMLFVRLVQLLLHATTYRGLTYIKLITSDLQRRKFTAACSSCCYFNLCILDDILKRGSQTNLQTKRHHLQHSEGNVTKITWYTREHICADPRGAQTSWYSFSSPPSMLLSPTLPFAPLFASEIFFFVT